MEEFFERLNTWYKKFFKYVRLLILVLVAYFLLQLFPYVFPAFLPVIIGFLLAQIVSVGAGFFMKKCKMKRPLAIVCSLVLYLGVIASILFAVIRFLINKIQSLILYFVGVINAGRAETLQENWTALFEELEENFSFLPHETIEMISGAFTRLIEALTGWITSAVSPITGGAISIVRSAPQAVIFIVVMFMTAYFFLADHDRIFSFAKEKAPLGMKKLYHALKEQLIFAFNSYIKAQLILMSIAAIELSVGFFVTGIITNNSMLKHFWIVIAILVAVVDAIPVLGVGAVTTPWAIVSLLMGNFKLAICLWIIQAVCFTVRQIIEPRIVSQKIGLHPIVTLTCIYCGLYFFGVFGMILVPVSVLVIINLYKAGTFAWVFRSE